MRSKEQKDSLFYKSIGRAVILASNHNVMNDFIEDGKLKIDDLFDWWFYKVVDEIDK